MLFTLAEEKEETKHESGIKTQSRGKTERLKWENKLFNSIKRFVLEYYMEYAFDLRRASSCFET